ncbi:MAG TPA: cytochrome c3 family protein [Kofleriaceae bacterium]|nr:cytochrome c3 family protein [Kofleriaceae bacterium]
MRATPLVPALLLLAGLPAALAGAPSAAPPPRLSSFDRTVSPVVYPDQQLPLHFSHVRHLAIPRVDCGDCHAAAAESRSSLDSLLPGEDRCRACHAIDRAQPDKPVARGEPPARCAACHPGPAGPAGAAVARVVVPTARIKFDHRAHRLAGAGCRDCHGDLAAERVELATRDQLPPMALCLRCHDGRRAPERCTTCHLTQGGGRIMTDFPGGKLAPSGALRGNDAHDLSFRADHAAAARADESYCASCHRRSECADCHQGTMKPLDFHGNDYVSLHAIDARRGRPDCSACHRLQTFCVGCHSRTGVSADGKGGELVPPSRGPGPRFHPAGWVDLAGGAPVGGDASRGANHHAFEAQRNIRQCAACHRESFCLGCHSAQPGSARIDPHPEGWRGSRRCEALLRRARRMCLRCHVDPAEVSCGW